MKMKNRLFITVMALVILFVGILPANFNMTYAENKENDKANLLERAISGFFLMGALGTYVSICVVAGESISIESLIFNKYGNTRLSFFDGNFDKTNNSIINPYIKDNGIITALNDFTAMFTKTAIIAYMMILVYMGIRILLGATAERGSKYKELLTYWVQGLVVLFFFPFVIKGTIMLNDAFVQYIYSMKASIFNIGDNINPSTPSPKTKGLGGMETEMQSAQQHFTQKNNESQPKDYMAMMFQLTVDEGWLVYAICWTVMVKQLLTLLVIYFKRVLTIAFLIAIYPLVTISYAIDKVGDGKSQAFENWYKEFALNVFLQSFHAIVYVIGMAMIISIGQKGSISDKWLLVVFIISFIGKGDDMLRNIFHMQGGGGDTVAGVAKTMLQVRGMAKLAKGTRAIINNKIGPNSRLGKFENKVSDLSSARLANSLRNETMRSLLLDEQDEALGTLNIDTQAVDLSAPLTTGEMMQSNVDTLFNAEATDEEKKKAMENVMASINTASEEDVKALNDYIEETYGVEAAKQMRGILAARNVKVDFNEKIEILLQGMKSGRVKTAYRGKVRTEEEMQKLRELSNMKFKKPTPQKAINNATKQKKGTKVSGDRYSGRFISQASLNMQRANAKHTPKTFRQKIVGAGATVGQKVVGARVKVGNVVIKTGKKYKAIKNEGIRKYAKARIKNTALKTKGKFVDVSQKAKMKIVETKTQFKRATKKYVLSKDEKGKLKAGSYFIERSNAKVSKQKDLYMRQAAQFRKMGRIEDAKKIEDFINNPGTKHLRKVFGVRIGGGVSSLRLARTQAKLNIQSVKTARAAIWERRRGNIRKAKELESAVAEHRITRLGRAVDPNMLGKPTFSQKILDKGIKKDSSQKDLYMRQAAQFRKMGRIEDAKKIEDFVNNSGTKHLKKVFGVRIGGGISSLRLARTQAKLNIQSVKAAKAAIWERRRGNIEKAKELESAIAEHRVTRLGKANEPKFLRKPTFSQKILDRGTQIDSLIELRRIRKKGTRQQIAAAEKYMAARSLAVRNNLRSNNIYLKNRDFVEYATNFKVYKKAKVREVVDRIRLVESDFKSAKQIITDRKNGGRNSLYENARKNIEDANNIRTKLRKQGVYVKPIRLAAITTNALGILDSHIDKRIGIRDAREKYGTAKNNSYRKLRESSRLKESDNADEKREGLRLEAEAVSEIRKTRKALKRSGALLVGPTLSIDYAESNVKKELQRTKRIEKRIDERIKNTENRLSNLDNTERRTKESIDTAMYGAGFASPIRKLAQAKRDKIDEIRMTGTKQESRLKYKLENLRETQDVISQERAALMGIARDAHISVTSRTTTDRAKETMGNLYYKATATPGKVADAIKNIGSQMEAGVTKVPGTVINTGKAIKDMPEKVKKQWDGILEDIKKEMGERTAETIASGENVPTANDTSGSTTNGGTYRVMGYHKPSISSALDEFIEKTERAEKEATESKATKKKKSGEEDSSTLHSGEIKDLERSIDIINDSSLTMYTATELLQHIEKIKQMKSAFMPGTPEYTAAREVLDKLKYNLGDYEANLRIQVLNDTELVAKDDPNRRKVIDNSISYVQHMPEDNILLSTLMYDPNELRVGEDPMRRVGTRYGTTEEESQMSSKFKESLREKQIKELEKEIETGRKEIRSAATGVVKSGVSAVIDVTVGMPLGISAGLLSAGIGASATNSGDLVTQNALSSGVLGYSLANKGYDKVGKRVEKIKGEVSETASSIREKLTRNSNNSSNGKK